MSIPNPLTHIDEYGEANLDSVTLRHLLDHAQASIAYNRETLRMLPKEMKGDYARLGFEEEDKAHHAAIERIKAELKRRPKVQA